MAGCNSRPTEPSPPETSRGLPAGFTEAEWGERLFASEGCGRCHSVDGRRGIGAPLDGLYGKTRHFLRGGSTVADSRYVRESVLHPNLHIVENYKAVMPSYEGRLTEAELDALVAYIHSLSPTAAD